MKKRIERLRAEFKELGIDAFLVTNSAKVRYLTGFEGMENPCLVTLKNVYLLLNPRDEEQARQEAKNCEIIVRGFQELKIISEQKLLEPKWKVGLENDIILEDYELLKTISSQNEFICCGSLIDGLSSVKDKKEIQKIKKALRITEEVYEKHILPQIQPGITEKDLAAEISYWGNKYGAEKDAFDIIVASGERSCIPHGTASSKKLQVGDIIQFDFGHVVDGYPSDFSRVVFLGELTEKQKEIYNIVLTAQEMAIKAAKPGMRCYDLDKVARDYIKNKGYDIPHSLGHGLGIMIHCKPLLNQGAKDKLKTDHVVTIEPGIYIPGWGGIRLEDVIVITKDGCKNLTKFTKEIIIR